MTTKAEQTLNTATPTSSRRLLYLARRRGKCCGRALLASMNGMTDEQKALSLGVSRRTIANWKRAVLDGRMTCAACSR